MGTGAPDYWLKIKYVELIELISRITLIDTISTISTVTEITSIEQIKRIADIVDLVVQGSSGVAFRQAASVAGAWQSPNGHSDPDSAWKNETYAYDEDIDTGSQTETTLAPSTWSSYLHLTTASIQSNQIRFTGIIGHPTAEHLIDIDVKKNGVWIDVYEGIFTHDDWSYWAFGQGAVTECRIRFYNVGDAAVNFQVKEVDFWQVASTGGELITKYQPPTTLLAGEKVVADGDTPEALAASTGVVNSVLVQAKSDNTGEVYIGNAAGQYVELNPLDAPVLVIDDLANIYIDVVIDGDGVNYVGS